MTIIKVAIGTLKLLMLLGIVETVVPGLSYDVAKQLVSAVFQGGR